jgi:hypothetical protein
MIIIRAPFPGTHHRKEIKAKKKGKLQRVSKQKTCGQEEKLKKKRQYISKKWGGNSEEK